MISTLSYTQIMGQFTISTDNNDALEDFLKVFSALWLLAVWSYNLFVFGRDVWQSIAFVIDSSIIMFVDRIVSIGFNAFLPGLG